MKLYVLVRKDLDWPQRAVQGAHAVQEFMSKHGHEPLVKEWAENHKTMVFLGVESEAQLLQWAILCLESGLPNGLSIEPDIGDQGTALAVLPSDQRLFKGLRLLR